MGRRSLKLRLRSVDLQYSWRRERKSNWAGLLVQWPWMSVEPASKFGPYQVIAPIGEGGMGQVFKARDTRLDRIVALKISHAQFSDRFAREARAIAALNHPHIATLYDVGPDYLVMEFVQGETLGASLKNGPLSTGIALGYAAQIAQAVAAAHNRGIIHRDLKPGNIML